MEVRATNHARISSVSNQVSTLNTLTLLDSLNIARKVSITRLKSIAMINNDHSTICACISPRRDGSIAGCIHGRADFRSKVNSTMHCFVAHDWMSSHSVCACKYIIHRFNCRNMLELIRIGVEVTLNLFIRVVLYAYALLNLTNGLSCLSQKLCC